MEVLLAISDLLREPIKPLFYFCHPFLHKLKDFDKLLARYCVKEHFPTLGLELGELPGNHRRLSLVCGLDTYKPSHRHYCGELVDEHAFSMRDTMKSCISLFWSWLQC